MKLHHKPGQIQLNTNTKPPKKAVQMTCWRKSALPGTHIRYAGRHLTEHTQWYHLGLCIAAVYLVPILAVCVCDGEPSTVPWGYHSARHHPHQHASFTAQIKLISCNNDRAETEEWMERCRKQKVSRASETPT